MWMTPAQKINYRKFLTGLQVKQGDEHGLFDALRRLQKYSLAVVPQILFRYRRPDEHSFRDLEKGEVTLSNPVAFCLGDPDDAKMMPDVSGLAAVVKQASDPSIAADWVQSIDLEALAELSVRCGRSIPVGAVERVSNMVPEELTAWLGGAGKALLAGASGSVIPELEKAREILRVVCLTGDRMNAKMWDEYAERHTGFVLAYRAGDLRMCDFANQGAVFVLPVLYDDAPFDDEKTLQWGILCSMGLDVATDDELASIRAAYRKAVKYEYEQEWRVCIFRKEGENDELYVQRPCSPVSITVGRCASEETLRRCRKAADRFGIPLEREG